MDMFLIYYHGVLTGRDTQIIVDGGTVNILQLYPLFRSEVSLISTVGVSKFLDLVGIDIYDAKRPRFQFAS